MKNLTIILSAFLILLLCLSLAACGGSDKSADGATEAVTEAPTEPDNGIGKSFKIDGTTIEVTETTGDLTDVLSSMELKSAEGKYVAVVLTITDGKLDAGKLKESVSDVKLDDYTCVNAIAKGVTIEGDYAYAIGTIYAIYDVPEEYDLTGAVVTVPA